MKKVSERVEKARPGAAYGKVNRTAARTSPPAAVSQEKSISEAGRNFAPKTKMGQQLLEIRQRIVASGRPLLNWQQVNQEVARRWGELE